MDSNEFLATSPAEAVYIRGPQGEQGIQGVQGIQGKQGTPFNFVRTFESIDAMSAAIGSLSVGDYVIIDATNNNWLNHGAVYQKTGDSITMADMHFVTNLSGITGAKGDTGEQGAKGDKGDKGDPFSLYKTYATVEAMNADATVPAGAFVMIAGEGADAGRLFTKINGAFTDLGYLNGIKGDKGNDGEPGAPYKITKVYDTAEAMQADIANLAEGNFVYIDASAGGYVNHGELYRLENGALVRQGNVAGPRGIQGMQGAQGTQGAQGEPFSIAQTFTSKANLDAAVDALQEGDYAIIDARTTDYIEHGNLYQKKAGALAFVCNIAGIPGPKGERGEPFAIEKTFPSVTDMLLDESIEPGKLVIISCNVDLEDNAKVFIKKDVGYALVTDLSGATGIVGPKGDTGDKGDKGEKGDKGDTPTSMPMSGVIGLADALDTKQDTITAQDNAADLTDTDAFIDTGTLAGNTTPKRHALSKLWTWIKTKADAIYATVAHTHAIANITNLQTTLDNKMPINGRNNANPLSLVNNRNRLTETSTGIGLNLEGHSYNTYGVNISGFGNNKPATRIYGKAEDENGIRLDAEATTQYAATYIKSTNKKTDGGTGYWFEGTSYGDCAHIEGTSTNGRGVYVLGKNTGTGTSGVGAWVYGTSAKGIGARFYGIGDTTHGAHLYGESKGTGTGAYLYGKSTTGTGTYLGGNSPNNAVQVKIEGAVGGASIELRSNGCVYITGHLYVNNTLVK